MGLQEEVALNRRKNKVDMEKIFATVISLAIMVALVVGIASILKSNNSEDKDKHNYIDLNEINEALSGEDVGDETVQQAANEGGEKQDEQQSETETVKHQTADRETDRSIENDGGKSMAEATGEVDKLPGKDIELPGKDIDSDIPKDSGEAGNTDVAQAVGDEGAEGTEGSEAQVAQAESTAPAVEDGTVASDVASSNGAASEVDGADSPADVPAGENVDSDATPVSASTATLLGYNFSEDSTIMWPAQGNVILNYNMTSTIYFPTLDVYKCNPAIVISAGEDSIVSAAADGLVIAVYESSETGLTMEIALGNDYVMTYGQLKNLTVGVGSQVRKGDAIASVAAPSSYYTVEGSNLYFRIDKDGASVNPMDYIETE